MQVSYKETGINRQMGVTKRLLFIVLVCSCGCLSAQTVHVVRDSVKIHFRQGKIDLVPEFRDNRRSLERIADSLRTSYAAPVYRLRKILVVGGASPEGSVKRNKWLSEKRAYALFDNLSRCGTLPDSLKSADFLGRDWNGLIRLVKEDSEIPYKEEVLELLHQIADEAQGKAAFKGDHLGRIQRLRDGAPYYYMYRKLFPELRATRLYLWYEKALHPAASLAQVKTGLIVLPAGNVLIHDKVNIDDTCYADKPGSEEPFYMDLRTNMLYDALLVPNIGIEFYLGRNWSVVGNWMYGWWSKNRSHWYWRAYGGDLAVRKWLGKAAKRKPLTGHHLGVYGQIFTYDFETGKRGCMGGKPGGTLWDRMNCAAGVEYGYSLPLARRLNIDFTIGAGYWGGTYHEYIPVDDCYVWQATRQRRWFGPTKAEVSLVWLIGRGNCNKEKKGGKR